jgi:cell pole-organizing protein PopZ
MEEILASIRRIIADDEASKPAPAPAPKLEPVAAVAMPTPESAPEPTAPPRPTVVPGPRPVAAVPAPEPMPEPAKEAMQESVNASVNAPVVEPANEPEDVLDLTEAMTAPQPSFRTIDGQSDVVFTERPLDAEPAARASEEVRKPAPHGAPDAGLLSPSTKAAVDSAFNSLAYTVFGQNARTLEDLVKEMLRPMLKSWLDDNLPGLVERIVRAEIERVSRGRG